MKQRNFGKKLDLNKVTISDLKKPELKDVKAGVALTCLNPGCILPHTEFGTCYFTC